MSNVKQSDKSFRVCNLAWRSVVFLPGGFNRGSSQFVHDLPAKKSAIQKPHFRYIRMGGLINDSNYPFSLLSASRSLRSLAAACFDRAEIKRQRRSLIPGQYGLPSVSRRDRTRQFRDRVCPLSDERKFYSCTIKKNGDNQAGR